MTAHAREQLAPAQKAHELAYIAGVGGDAFGDGVACERLAIFGEGDKAENVHSVAELGGIFIASLLFDSDVNFIITTY